jgi:hypothetical protein
MGEVKRDEAKRVCEAVGWKWDDGPGWYRHDDMDDGRPWTDLALSGGEALALLEAFRLQDPMFRDWSLEGPVDYDKEDGGFRACVTDRLGDGKTSWYYDHPDAPEAAVRAVLAWKEARDA